MPDMNLNGYDRFACPEAEDQVIGALLIDGAALDCAGSLEPEDFADPDNGTIFDALRAMVRVGAPPDIINLSRWLGAGGHQGAPFDLVSLNAIAQTTLSVRNLARHSEIIQEAARQRRIADAQARAAADIASAHDPLAAAEHAMQAIQEAMGPRAEPRKHPLAEFVPLLLDSPRRPEFVIDDVIAAGVVVIAGGRGTGKTTALLPLFAKAAHLCRPDDPLKPKLRRRVIWITEDAEHARRVLYSCMNFGGVSFAPDVVADWFKLVPALRMPVDEVVAVAAEYAKLAHTNTGASGAPYDAMPVVVMDTYPSTVDIDDENSNARGSAIIAALKQRFAALPLCLLAHTPKSVQRGDLDSMTTRGAGSIEGDANQVAYLFTDDGTGKRYLAIGGNAKKRFESNVEEIEFDFVCNTVTGVDVLDDRVSMKLAHCEAKPGRTSDRREAASEAKELEQHEAETERRTKALRYAADAWAAGSPLSSTALAKKIGGKLEFARDTVATLLDEDWLITVDVPAARRYNPRRSHFLICLDAVERDAYRRKRELLPEKLALPVTWAKPEAETT